MWTKNACLKAHQKDLLHQGQAGAFVVDVGLFLDAAGGVVAALVILRTGHV